MSLRIGEAGMPSPRADTRGRAISVPAAPPCFFKRTSRKGSVRTLVRVDLRALETTREIHVDRLPLREHLDARDPGLPMAVAGVLDAAKRQVDLRADRRRVHVED